MSEVLNEILVQAADQYPATVALSPDDVTVLLYALSFLERKRNWYTGENPLDEITPEDWDTIEKLVASVYEQVMNPMIGMIFPIVTTDPPENCLLCDGSEYAREDFPLLYERLDAAFILDADTFFVPNLQSRTIVGAGTGDGLSTYTVNQESGDEAITLSSAQMPIHQHGLFTATAVALAPGELPVVIPSIVAAGLTDLAGGGGSHENRMPSTALNFAVVAQ